MSLQRKIQEMNEQECHRVTRQGREWDTDIRTEFLERESDGEQLSDDLELTDCHFHWSVNYLLQSEIINHS